MRPRGTPSAGGHEARRCRSRSRAVGRGAGRPRGAVPDAGGPGLGRARSGPRTLRRVGCAPSPSASSDPARAARWLPGARAPGPSGSFRRRRSADPGGRHRRGSPQTDACPGGGGDRTGARGPDARLRAAAPSFRQSRRASKSLSRHARPCTRAASRRPAWHRSTGPSLGRLAPVPATGLRLEPRRARSSGIAGIRSSPNRDLGAVRPLPQRRPQPPSAVADQGDGDRRRLGDRRSGATVAELGLGTGGRGVGGPSRPAPTTPPRSGQRGPRAIDRPPTRRPSPDRTRPLHERRADARGRGRGGFGLGPDTQAAG